ncbi:MAG: multidrug resistance efflux transporter family protein [Lachnospiraceae bacterium]|nr:multidrug resistance efflux transporter family protein [Lachnospiraceae bacterium]
MSETRKTKAFLLGIVGSFFFAFTFVLNRSMNLGGGYWMYSAILRYLFTLPILLVMLMKGKQYLPVLADIRKQPVRWLIWSTVGFGLFYLPLTAASLFAESWFTCAMWQVTIVCGVLLTPLFGRKIPVKNLSCSCLILVGIFLMQMPYMRAAGGIGDEGASPFGGIGMAFILILIGAFSYPLGNRKTMSFCDEKLTTIQRVFGMTLCSMPFWIVSGVVALIRSGAPTGNQCVQALGVAVFSGVIATVLFFRATDMVRQDARALAAVEATQCGEVIFTLLLGIIVLKDAPPSVEGWSGIGIIVVGMVLTSLVKG